MQIARLFCYKSAVPINMAMAAKTPSQLLQELSQSLSTLGSDISAHSSVMGLLASASVIRNAPIRSSNQKVESSVASLKSELVTTVTNRLCDNNANDPNLGYFAS